MDEQELTRKIGLLLKKAEGTDNENEASTFYGKAYELMTRYAIDEARVRAVAKQISGRQVEEPVVEDYMYSSYAHHAKAKEELFTTVAKSQGVRFWPYSNRKYSNNHRVVAAGKTGLYESQWGRVLGYKDDIENAKLLYMSLLIQSTRFANEDWRKMYGEAKRTGGYYGDGKFMWMSAHMEGFAHRIGERFNELREAIYTEVKDANALILDKDANILEWMYEHGYARRPSPPKYYCWAIEPEERRPFNADGRTKSKKWKPAYCIIVLPLDEEGQPQPHEGEHAYTYHSPKMSSSYYVAKGRRESYEGREVGKSAANRADIGLSRVSGAKAALRSGGG